MALSQLLIKNIDEAMRREGNAAFIVLKNGDKVNYHVIGKSSHVVTAILNAARASDEVNTALKMAFSDNNK